MVSKLMVFVQDSSALDEIENVKSMEFGGGIKMKKTITTNLNRAFGRLFAD